MLELIIPCWLLFAQPAPNPPGSWSSVIQYLNGDPVEPSLYKNNLAGFALYLKASGVNQVTAEELTHPFHPDLAAKLGYALFLPHQEWWPKGAALALIAQKIRTQLGLALTIRNWWRPAAYNSLPAVGGAKEGDHVEAYGMDLDYSSVLDRVKAERFLRALHETAPWLRLSLGFGPTTTHIGLLTPRGHREWHYPGYTPPDTISSAGASNGHGKRPTR